MSDTRQELLEAVQQAIGPVERCREAPAPEAKELFGQAMLNILRARNEYLRATPAGAAAADSELRRINATLSLMASIEFPLGGFHRERLDQVARELAGRAPSTLPRIHPRAP